MSYRLIAIDLDDTLLDHNLKISPRNKKAIREAARRGVKVTIATGRMFRSSLPYVRDLELNEDWPMINYHGALIKTTASRKVIYHCPLANDTAVSIAEEAEKGGYTVNVYIDDRLYVERENEMTDYYSKIADVELEAVGPLTAYLRSRGEDPSKMTVINWDGRLDKIQKKILERYGRLVSALQSRPYFLELTDRRATKGQTLQRLAKLEGIGREEIVAFGDSYNDIDMIRFAGLGIAVENARPEVLEAADLVTASNVDDGVARAIEQYILT